MIRAHLLILLALASCGNTQQSKQDQLPEQLAPEGTRLGASITGDSVWFRVKSRNASHMEVWLYSEAQGDVSRVLVLTPSADETFEGKLSLADVQAAGTFYGIRAWGPNWPYDPSWTPGSDVGFESDVDAAGNRFNPNKLLLDPYGREISHDPGTDWWPYTSGERRTDDTGPFAPKSVILAERAPVGDGPERAPQDHVIYEVHVRGLTMLDPDVPEALRGTYAGAALRASKLAELGVTAIELLPIHETVNDQNDLTSDAQGDNYWGYMTLGFFAPDRRYSSDKTPGGPTAEFAAMVEAFHAAGISVFMDVVYNHTAEGGPWNQAGDVAAHLSWRGIDNQAYYQLSGPNHYRNDNGVGPNLNAGDVIARDMVIDSLSYFAHELGVDGFRFDLAPILGNKCIDGCWNYDPGNAEGILVRAVNEVDALMIAEPWGATGDAYQVGNFPMGWSEWNDHFRDTVRRDQNRLGVSDQSLQTLVDVWVGTPGRYADEGREPWASVPFISAHDGLTHADIYTCNDKNNGQGWPYGPSDGGSDNNTAWDHGGDATAQRQAQRTGMALLLLSSGMPMFNGGDELLHSLRCNNNAYNLDSEATWLDWAALEEANTPFYTMTQRLLAFRQAHVALRPATWRSHEELVLYEPEGAVASGAYLNDATRHALGFWLDGDALGDTARAIYILYNGWSGEVSFNLPTTPSGETWKLFLDTNAWRETEPEGSAFPVGEEGPLPGNTYGVGGRSLVVLVDP